MTAFGVLVVVLATYAGVQSLQGMAALWRR